MERFQQAHISYITCKAFPPYEGSVPGRGHVCSSWRHHIACDTTAMLPPARQHGGVFVYVCVCVNVFVFICNVLLFFFSFNCVTWFVSAVVLLCVLIGLCLCWFVR
jgi:hypothetical protein